MASGVYPSGVASVVQVFVDPTGGRLRWTRLLVLGASVLVFAYVALVVGELTSSPWLPGFGLPGLSAGNGGPSSAPALAQLPQGPAVAVYSVPEHSVVASSPSTPQPGQPAPVAAPPLTAVTASSGVAAASSTTPRSGAATSDRGQAPVHQLAPAPTQDSLAGSTVTGHSSQSSPVTTSSNGSGVTNTGPSAPSGTDHQTGPATPQIPSHSTGPRAPTSDSGQGLRSIDSGRGGLMRSTAAVSTTVNAVTAMASSHAAGAHS